MKDLFLIMHHPCIKLNSYCIKQCVSCQDFCFPFLRCLHCYHCLLGGTVGCHRDCIRSCYSCVILAELQAETEGYANCLAIIIDDIEMIIIVNVATCSCQVLVLLFSFSLPTKETLPLLPSPSSSSQRPWQHPAPTKSQLLFSGEGPSVTMQ